MTRAGLVTFGQTPAKVQDELMIKIREQCGLGVRQRHFTPGEQVELAHGPFAGLEAIYQMADGEGRVMVLLNILSKPVKLSIEPAAVRKLC